MASFRGRQKKASMTLQLPPHVQANLNKEVRLLQRNLADLEKETRHRMRCIVQDQHVATIKLRSLEARLQASQKKFHCLIHHKDSTSDCEEEKRRDSMSIYARKLSNADYYLSLLAPVVKEEGQGEHGREGKSEKQEMEKLSKKPSVEEAGEQSKKSSESEGEELSNTPSVGEGENLSKKPAEEDPSKKPPVGERENLFKKPPVGEREEPSLRSSIRMSSVVEGEGEGSGDELQKSKTVSFTEHNTAS